MASEIRVDKITSLSGVGTITPSPTGIEISGITTVATLKATTGIVTTLTATTGIVTTLTANTVTSLGAVSGTTGTFSSNLAVSGASNTLGNTTINGGGGAGGIALTVDYSGTDIFRIVKDFNGLPCWLVKAVGGTATHWAGATPRFLDYEFKTRSTYGNVKGASLLDWPISLKDMEPYYVKAEDAIGSTHRGGRKPLPANNNYKVFANGAKKVGYKYYEDELNNLPCHTLDIHIIF